jgi:hypothetical protein
MLRVDVPVGVDDIPGPLGEAILALLDGERS